MKKKSIKKLAKLLYQESRNLEKHSLVREDYSSSFEWSEFDQDISAKFKKLIFNISNYSKNVNLRIHEDRISISVDDYTSIKTSGTRSSKLRPVSEERHLEILIIKDIGFTINQGYMYRTSFKDEKMYEELKESLSKLMRQINAEDFNHIWSSIMTETGLSRDNNLDEILNG